MNGVEPVQAPTFLPSKIRLWVPGSVSGESSFFKTKRADWLAGCQDHHVCGLLTIDLGSRPHDVSAGITTVEGIRYQVLDIRYFVFGVNFCLVQGID